MLNLLIIAGTIYVGLLVFLTWLARRGSDRSSKNYLMAGSNLGAFLGLFTFAATLFSTFTILGMPDFFRTHGVGAWTFLAVADLFMFFGLLWIGYYVRRRIRRSGVDYYGMAGFMHHCYQSKFASYVIFMGAFLFLIPYVAIQINGVASFLTAAFPNAISFEAWAILIMVTLIIYSELGGLKAIIYSDMLQGIMLLVVIWIIGIVCVGKLGGVEQMFIQVAEKDPALLSMPGPKGLFNIQFLIASLIGIMMIPFTQPQVSTRLVIMRDKFALYKTALALGFFAILVILPTLFIGMYGSVNYSELSAPEYWQNTYINDQKPIIAVLVTIGLIAAAISTADSQLFALGGETRSLLKGEDKKMLTITRIAILVFAALSLAFAIMSSNELVLLAVASFSGTALMAPMIFLGIFSKGSHPLKQAMPVFTLVAILVFILYKFNISFIPAKIIGFNMDLFLIIVLAALALVAGSLSKEETVAATA